MGIVVVALVFAGVGVDVPVLWIAAVVLLASWLVGLVTGVGSRAGC